MVLAIRLVALLLIFVPSLVLLVPDALFSR
jgi:hypothetical protein